MFIAMCRTLTCRKPLVSSCHHSPDADVIGVSAPSRNQLGAAQPALTAALDHGDHENDHVDHDQRDRHHRLLPATLPEIVRATGRLALLSATHWRQWKPTDAGVRHSGQAGRPHRLQDSAVAGPDARCRWSRTGADGWIRRRLGHPVPVRAAGCQRSIGRVSSTVIDSMTTSLVGRSKRSTGVAEMASTTAIDAGSVTSPKIVCLQLRCG